jgi:pyruvate,water dikinase
MTAMDGITVYSNRIAREVLLGMIKPLVWSINIPLVNTAWIRLLSELTGPNDIRPEELARAFHYRAYFNMTTLHWLTMPVWFSAVWRGGPDRCAPAW